jgi:hypothetical protein
MSELVPIESQDDSLALIRTAVEKGIGVDGLERLVALKERADAKRAEAEALAAFAEFQRTCPQPAKTKTAKIVTKSGGTFSYSYAPLEDIAETLRGPLAKAGFSYRWDSEETPEKIRCTCTLSHVGGHSFSATHTCPLESTDRMSGAQRTKAALTYAMRCSLIQVTGITSADPDPDGAIPGDVAAAYITESQQADLDALISEVGADRAKFLRWAGVGAVSEILAKDFQRVVGALEARRGK